MSFLLRPSLRSLRQIPQITARSSSTTPASKSHLPRELPKLQNKWPLYVSVAAFVGTCWAGFVLFATNYERASSSVVRTLIYKIKVDERLQQALGDQIKPVPFFVGSEPWVSGHLNLLQGSVDVAFPIEGSKGRAIALFTSIRRSADERFEIIRWKVILPDGKTIDLNTQEL